MKKGMVVCCVLVALWIGGCLAPVVRPTAEFSYCLDGSEGKLDYVFVPEATTVPGHYVESYEWSIEGAAVGEDPLVGKQGWELVHRFVQEGTAYVTLVVADDRGVSSSVTKEVSVQHAAFVHSDPQLSLGFPVKLTGIVESQHPETLSEVSIKAKFYDVDGIRLTAGTVVVEDLEPGEKAMFTVQAEEYGSRIFYGTVDIDSYETNCSSLHPVY